MKKHGRVTTDKRATFKTASSPSKLVKFGNAGNTKGTTLPGDGCAAGRKSKVKAA